MATPLAEQADVEAVLGRSLDPTEEERIDNLLARGSFQARRIAGANFAPGDYTTTRRPDARGRVRLADAVDEVTAVRGLNDTLGTVETADPTGYTVRGSTIYGLTAFEWYEIDYTVTADIPDDVRRATAEAVGSLILAPTGAARTERAGPFEVTYEGVRAAVDEVRDVFLAYALPTQPIRLI